MKAHQAIFRIATMCRVLGVSSSGYYAWLTRRRSMRACEDEELQHHIREIHDWSDGTYGAPRIHAELVARKIRVGRKRVARLMRVAGLAGVSRRKFVTTTVRDREAKAAADLVERDFTAKGPDELWVADIERHEAPLNRVVVKGHHCQPVAAGWLKLRAA
ncbi:MAG: IS3 family transposase [Candidatus Eisenbacteria sp.]|nr:IS3 family transposase [Candidatus Eisenbacteria bacterium]